LKRATDEDLERLDESLQRAAANLLAGLDWKAMDEFPSSFTALMDFRDFVVAEQHQRQDAIRHAEAELNDGHLETEIWPYLDAGCDRCATRSDASEANRSEARVIRLVLTRAENPGEV